MGVDELKKILYLTDLAYKAKGRDYSKEDIYIADRLKDRYDVVLAHPKCAEGFEDHADAVVFRNTGSVIGYKDIYYDFLRRVEEKRLKTFNSFDGKADMRGKQYLLELTAEAYPVIPTVDSMDDINVLPESETYVIKPKDGADSIGLEFAAAEELKKRGLVPGKTLIQPAIDFQYEVSFYFINDKLEYAMYAPDKTKRWELAEYDYTDEDAAFARKFIEWNTVKHGIQRVDACRTRDGRLLLVELEDLNPYLSILEVKESVRNQFLQDMAEAIDKI
ncbi:MAG: hypothetical protein IKR21_04745 [Oscillospiraceae bacterium]|nr:hypothetical protein [Oscillospiraceae bacterium]